MANSGNYKTYTKKYTIDPTAFKAARRKEFSTQTHLIDKLEGLVSLGLLKQWEAPKGRNHIIKDSVLFKVARLLRCNAWDIVKEDRSAFHHNEDPLNILVQTYHHLRSNLPNTAQTHEILVSYADRLVEMLLSKEVK